MKVSDIFDTIMDINRLIDVMLQDKHDLATQDIEKICDLLLDYREDLLKKKRLNKKGENYELR